MNTVIFPPPPKETLDNFILQNNWIDNCDIMMDDIKSTLQRKCIQPFAAGHIMAIEFVLKKLAMNPNWPAKHPLDYSTEAKSTANLKWVFDLHEKLMRPICRFNDFLKELNYIDEKDVGVHRLYHMYKNDGRTGNRRWMPKPTGIPRLMHWWYSEMGSFHLNNIKKLQQGVTLTEMNEFSDKAELLHTQFLCIHPFASGNGRSARLIENALRLRWGLAWKTYKKQDSIKYSHRIMDYEDSAGWQKLLHELEAHPKDRA